MNISQKCNCCVCEPVCKYKEIYKNGVQAILDTNIKGEVRNEQQGFWRLKDCPHIEVSIKCPHMVTHSASNRTVIE